MRLNKVETAVQGLSFAKGWSFFDTHTRTHTDTHTQTHTQTHAYTYIHEHYCYYHYVQQLETNKLLPYHLYINRAEKEQEEESKTKVFSSLSIGAELRVSSKILLRMKSLPASWTIE